MEVYDDDFYLGKRVMVINENSSFYKEKGEVVMVFNLGLLRVKIEGYDVPINFRKGEVTILG